MRTRSIPLLTTILCGFASGQTYTISTFAGVGTLPVNVPGTSVGLGPSSLPQHVAADSAGNVFFVDQTTVLRLDATTGILTLVAGNGTLGFSGDNGPATSAQLWGPEGVGVDSAGNLYVADRDAHRIRILTPVGSSCTYSVSPATLQAPVTGAITTATLPPSQVTPAPLAAIQVLINGQPALYTYAGEAPGMVAGLMQLNVQIPSTASSGPLSVQVSNGGNVSQTGIIVSVQ